MSNCKKHLGQAVDTSAIQAARNYLTDAQIELSSVNQTLNETGNKQDRLNDKISTGENKASSFVKAMLGLQVVQKVVRLVTNQLDSAISRYDTLNNYSKVMGNLGVDASAAEMSKKMLSEGLKGLPTTLNDAVSAVQRFTSANGNIKASTNMFLALNNALLAGGTSTEIQANALEQMSQAYAKGKLDMMEWRALQTAMPAQLKQIATAMGTTSTALGEGLRNGKIKMSDFMNTMIELNENGVDGFQSFAEQAKNATGGISTSISNMKSAITRGITGMIDSINTALESAGLGTISEQISNFGSALETVLTNIGTFVGNVIMFLSPVLQIIGTIRDFIVNNWEIIRPILQAIIIVLGVYYTYTLLAAIGTKILTAAMKLLTNPMLWVIILIVAIVAALIYLWNTNDTVAYYILYAWDALRLGAMALKLGVETAFYGIVIAGLYMYQGILGVKMGLQTAFYMIQLGALSLQLGFQGVAQGIVNAFIWMYNKIAEILNKLGGNFATMNYADFTSSTVNSISNKMSEYVDAIANTYGEMEDINGKISGYQQKLVDIANQGATKIQSKASEFNSTRSQRVAERLTASDIISNVTDTTAWNGLSSMVDDVSGISDASNGTAGNTADTAAATNNIADTLETTEEDLKYLRDLAEQEIINRFTTAEVKVDFTNYSNVNSNMDLDGVVGYLEEQLESAMVVAAEGYHF